MKTACTVAMLFGFTLTASVAPATQLPGDAEAASLAASCGNDVVDIGEECDGTSDVACPGMCNDLCACPPVTTIDIPSSAQPPDTPGSPGVDVTNPKLLEQFGADLDLNNARYTRFELDDSGAQPDAILILVPGFEGGANNFRILAQNLLQRAKARPRPAARGVGLRPARPPARGHRRAGSRRRGARPRFWLRTGCSARSWVCRSTRASRGEPSSTTRRTTCRSSPTGPTSSSPATSTRWSPRRSRRARNGNVFLGGHSAGTLFTARYAATDFDITPGCDGTPIRATPSCAAWCCSKAPEVRRAARTRSTDDTLDRIIAKFDGGLYGAVRDNAPRCVDGTAPCTIDTEADDCAGQVPPKCTTPTTSYALVQGALNPRVLASSEGTAIQAIIDLNDGPAIGQLDVGAPGNKPTAKVPDIANLAIIPLGTVEAGFGTFLNKNGSIAPVLSFVAMSVGEPGPTVDGVLTWKDILHGPLTPGPDLGPAPTDLPAGPWGMDKEVTRLDRVVWSFFAGRTNFSDWYYPNAGPSTTAGLNLDTSKLSAPPPAGRGRCDIENLTQAGDIDIPVIAFCGSAGLATVPGVYTAFAQSIGTCTAPSCDGSTPRVVDAAEPNPAFPTFGGVDGGFEVYVNEGFAHLDMVTAEDDADNHVVGPISDFIARNSILPAANPCVGDCDANSMVSVDELVRGVDIALGVSPLSECRAFDCNDTGAVDISCLVRAVDNALSGCPDSASG